MIVAEQKARPNWAFAQDAWNIVNSGMMMMMTTMIEAMAIVAVMAIVAMALSPDDDLIDIERN